MGPTSGNEVVPDHCGRRLSVRQRASWTRAVCVGHYPVRAQRLRRVARGTFLKRAALFAARCPRRCRSGAGNHGVSDPGARARRGPAPVRRGRSRHGCLCRFKLSPQHVRRREAPRVCRIERARSRLRSSGKSGPVCPGKYCPQPGHIPAVVAGQLLSWTWWLARPSHSMSTCDHGEVITSGVTSTPPAITTTMLHLCSAPCKALRFAPPARTRGLRALTVPARR